MKNNKKETQEEKILRLEKELSFSNSMGISAGIMCIAFMLSTLGLAWYVVDLLQIIGTVP